MEIVPPITDPADPRAFVHPDNLHLFNPSYVVSHVLEFSNFEIATTASREPRDLFHQLSRLGLWTFGQYTLPIATVQATRDIISPYKCMLAGQRPTLIITTSSVATMGQSSIPSFHDTNLLVTIEPAVFIIHVDMSLYMTRSQWPIAVVVANHDPIGLANELQHWPKEQTQWTDLAVSIMAEAASGFLASVDIEVDDAVCTDEALAVWKDLAAHAPGSMPHQVSDGKFEFDLVQVEQWLRWCDFLVVRLLLFTPCDRRASRTNTGIRFSDIHLATGVKETLMLKECKQAIPLAMRKDFRRWVLIGTLGDLRLGRSGIDLTTGDNCAAMTR
jgi:hypothetical protein